MKHSKTLVVPTNRKDCLMDFLKAWSKYGDWDNIIIIEDQPEKTFALNNVGHYSWKEIEEILGDDKWIISKQDSAIRIFGFLMAWKNGAEYILSLDDDCYPHNNFPIFARHIEIMENYHFNWVESAPGTRTRGLPYLNKRNIKTVMNMGLWTKNPDLDSMQSLITPIVDYTPPFGNRIMPKGQFFPLCGMNFCSHRSIIPALFFPLMGRKQPYSRFDDIWGGVILKKITDHLGLNLSVGEPFIEHRKKSNVFDNLIKEAPGIKANENFWETIDNIKFKKSSLLECMKEVGVTLSENTDNYLSKIGDAIKIWVSLFNL